MSSLGIDFADSELADVADEFIMSSSDRDEDELHIEIANRMSTLWADEGVQQCYLRSSEYQLNDSAGYFLDDLARISDSQYVPTQQDVLRVRVVTLGIVEFKFSFKSLNFK